MVSLVTDLRDMEMLAVFDPDASLVPESVALLVCVGVRVVDMDAVRSCFEAVEEAVPSAVRLRWVPVI